MFQKKQYIYSETQGVCVVENIVQLSVGKGESLPYYVLKSVFDETKVSYIPVNNHQVVLKELFSMEEALRLEQDASLKENEKLQEAIRFVLQKEKKENVTDNQ